MATLVENLSLRTLPDFITEALSRPLPRAVGERRHAATWHWQSSAEVLARARAVAYALRDAGLQRGERVALVSQNRADWIIADFGALLAGCVVVPVFATIAADQLAYILNDADVKLAFVETEELAERVRSIGHAARIVVFDADGSESLAAFEASGAQAFAADPARLEHFTDGIGMSDLAVLIYTSGTTGDPKGVMLSHNNLTSNAKDSLDYVVEEMHIGEPVLSVLPFSHIYEHTMLLAGLRRGFEFGITTPDFFARDLREVRPRFITLVPRIFERVLAGILSKSRDDGGLKAKLVPWALGVGRRHAEARCEGKPVSAALGLQYAIAQRLVLSKVRPAVGLDRLICCMSGSAPLHRDIAYTYAGLGIEICEGFGLTETSPVATTNRLCDNRIGTVGKAIPHVEVRIAEDGEVQVRGPNVMMGYYHSEQQPIDAEGWFSTGDIGALDADGYLRITDRKKELFKTSGGKYIAPARVEMTLRRSPYIGQALVTGSGQPFPVALIGPNWDLLRKELAIEGGDPAQLARRDDVKAFLDAQVRAQSADLAPFEQIRYIAVLPRELTVEDGDLSPAMKMRRRIVEERFSDLIKEAYASARS